MNVTVVCDGERITAALEVVEGRVEIELDQEIILDVGKSIVVELA